MSIEIAHLFIWLSDLFFLTATWDASTHIHTPSSLAFRGLYRNGLATVGPVAIAQVGQLHFDRFFMGARGIDLEASWTNANQLETQLKHAAIERSRQVCAIADSTKWGQRGFVSIVPFERVSTWVCDDDLPHNARSAAENAGIELLLAS
ncbi:hypothetical protein [Paraburkholderia humisilvae]|uniref:DeoR-like transcriptional repressor C-terminal sensor domain-containing protein n=1 Tax=Paraburkholderia humisilvae TaxID=627669 RepID=A0A6J5EEU0_9BURK|nr:hypothetical protein [Paraburkholderia humisilvae]CAB3765140.1 hypothetical protein LMG29542_05057 [Paraburkholderia humisilvae]